MFRGLTTHHAARLGGGLFVGSGLLTIVNNYAPGSETLDLDLLFAVGACAIAVGLVSWFLVPWEWLHPRTSLILPTIALGLVGITNAVGGVSGQTFSAFFVLIAAYIGATQPRWTTALFAIPIGIVYVLALQVRDGTSQERWSVTVVVPVCILVGELLSAALANAAAAQQRSARRAELLAVAARAARAVSSLDARRVLKAVADAALELGYHGVALEVFDADQGTYRVAEARGLPESFSHLTHASDSGITGEVRRQRTQVVFGDYAVDPRGLPDVQAAGFGVVIGTPIWTGTRMVAVLTVGSKAEIAVEAAELEVLVLLADQAGHALELAERHEQERRERQRYRRESLLDDLTGLGNRRKAEQIIDTARPGDAIVMLDLDDFKVVNDREGHAAGDLVLAGLGGFLRTKLRAGDAAARYGGEEFLLVIRRPGLDLLDAVERLRSGWLATNPKVSFSIGTAILRIGEHARDALARADGALLDAKAAGKNCVRHTDMLFMDGPPVPAPTTTET